MNSKTSTHAAPGQYFGYSVQTTRMLEALLAADPGSIISLEVLGDVAIEELDGSVLVEEVKSRIARDNPVSDRARDFWKSLANWVQASEQGILEPARTQFRLYLAQPFQAGPRVAALLAATTPEAARDALDSAQRELWGAPPNYERKASVGDTLAPHLHRFFGAKPSFQIQLVTQLSLETNPVTSMAALRATLARTAVPEELLEDVAAHLLGWIKRRTDTQIEASQPAQVAYDEFHRELTSFVRRLDRRTILHSFAPKPTEEEQVGHLHTRTYVSQLELIEETDDVKLRAVVDYLLAKSDRIQWAQRGYVNPLSFDELERNLERAWENLKIRVDVQHKSAKEIDRGRLLYAECNLHRALLEGLPTPDHFVPGSFHALADVRRVGWHPRYAALLSKKKEGEGT